MIAYLRYNIIIRFVFLSLKQKQNAKNKKPIRRSCRSPWNYGRLCGDLFWCPSLGLQDRESSSSEIRSHRNNSRCAWC